MSNNTFSLFRFVLFINIFILTMAQPEFNVTYYDHNPGIHFEKLGEMRLYNNKWKIITFVNIDNLSDKFLSLNNYYRKTLDLCGHENAQYHYYICESFIKHSKYSLQKIDRELQVLHELIGHKIVARNKRGWFDIIGKATKVLFGVLDSDDAKYYDQKISEFSKDESSVLHLLKEQTKIVQSTLVNFNNTIGTLDFNESILKGNIEKIGKQLNKNQKDIQFLTLKTVLEDHVVVTNIILNQLQLEIMSLTNAILVSKKGILHPAIITPVQLTKELRQVTESLPHGLEFPAPLDLANANMFLNIVELQVFFENKRLVYIINIPLVETQLFYLYKITPFPKLIALNEFILIHPSSKFIAIDESKQQFIQISDIEYTSCLKLLENKIICKQQKPVSLAHLVDNCEIKLLQGTSKIPENCDKRIVMSDRGIFIQLLTSNTWLFAVPQTETLTISCVNKNKPIDLILKNCGSVTLAKQCKAYSPSAMLVPHDNTYQSEMYSEIVPSVDISDECCEKGKTNQMNFSEILLSENYKILSKHIPELNIASHKLDDIERLADNIQKKKEISHYTTFTSTLAYILAIITVLFIVYKIYKKCCCPKNKNSCCGIIPNFCIRVNQNVEPSFADDRYVTRYVHRNRTSENINNADDSEEESIALQVHPRKSIGYTPTRRPTKQI